MPKSTVPTWDPNSLIEPEFLLPEQLADGDPRKRNGATGLLWAVFVDGIHTYCRGILRGSTANLAYREAERWIFRPDSDRVTSFANLCGLFGLDPRRLRRSLLRFREKPSPDIARLLLREAA